MCPRVRQPTLRVGIIFRAEKKLEERHCERSEQRANRETNIIRKRTLMSSDFFYDRELTTQDFMSQSPQTGWISVHFLA